MTSTPGGADQSGAADDEDSALFTARTYELTTRDERDESNNNDADSPSLLNVPDVGMANSSTSTGINELRSGIVEAEAGQSNEVETLPPDSAPVSGASKAPDSPLSSVSGPDDTPSIRESLPSSPTGSHHGTRSSSRLSISPALVQPFERRFVARVSSSNSVHRASSPAFLLAHSRQSSLTSQLTLKSQEDEREEEEGSEDTQKPWDVIRWTKLKKITHKAFSEPGKRAFGRPIYLVVAASIVVGTSKGLIMVFDYQQTLKNIIGQSTQAPECGPITSLAISADHSTVAAGHADGSIFTWDLAAPSRPFLYIPSLGRTQLQDGKSHGHVSGTSVLHIGFLGQRRTALVSADDSGMAFSHLASRGLGAVARSVRTTRILGRYPDLKRNPQKPSSVLAFAPLPLGNIERSTDELGLTALLTPYLLVVVSTTPIAQTQFKRPRDKDIAKHGALTGCLAWFPSIKLKGAGSGKSNAASRTKLAYCWSNVLNILEIEESYSADETEGQPPTLQFSNRSRWECDEAILTIQWISRSVIALLTLTQRLIVLEDVTMRVADFSDIAPKHIFHQDLFSDQLASVVDKIDQGDASMHGVIPDAFHMSFKAYKGRLFLLGVNDLFMGTLSNWADRLLALMGAEKHIAAIELATAYYNGETEKATIGLPEEDMKRHAIVKERLFQMISASLSYSFSEDRETDSGEKLRQELQQLVRACFKACLSMDEVDVIFDEVYPYYKSLLMYDIFFDELEIYVMNGKINLVSPDVFKDLLEWYSAYGYGERLEELICLLQTSTMDIEQVTTICRQLHLYDALAYVWNDAIQDFVTPLIHLISLITPRASHGQTGFPQDFASASKMFAYMAYTLTGRLYPSGNDLPFDTAIKAKASIYQFLTSHQTRKWPTTSSPPVLTQPDGVAEPTWPYLRVILDFDAFNFLSMLNEVFEDPFLNQENQEQQSSVNRFSVEVNGTDHSSVSRQSIIHIFERISSETSIDAEVRNYLNIFIARTYAKFHDGGEKIYLKQSTLESLLINLCGYANLELADECQLSIEYLLSVYHPPDINRFIPLFTKAGFYRVLKAVYRRSRQFSKWLQMFFETTEDQQGVFSCIKDVLGQTSTISRKQKEEVTAVVLNRARDLASIDATGTARILEDVAPELIDDMLNRLDDGSESQFLFLQQLLEPSHLVSGTIPKLSFEQGYKERYVALMCIHEPRHVAEYVETVDTGDLRLAKILPAMEESGVIDAEVTLMARDGLVREAMDRLVKHLRILGKALLGLVQSIEEDTSDITIAQDAVDDQVENLRKYIRIGIWLCECHSGDFSDAASITRRKVQDLSSISEESLTQSELLWLDLLDATVQVSRVLTSADSDLQVSDAVRAMVQDAFTSLLIVTTTKPSESTATSVSNDNIITDSQEQKPLKKPEGTKTVDFLAILSTFLLRVSDHSPTLTDLRKVLSDIFAAHAYEESILQLAQTFLNRDTFLAIENVTRRRKAGWMPLARTCGTCSRPIWGVGTGIDAWNAWTEKQQHDYRRRYTSKRPTGDTNNGKGKVIEPSSSTAASAATDARQPFVVFSCQHVFHKLCLESALAERQSKGVLEASVGYICLICD